MADASLPARIETGWVPAAMRGRAPALYRIPVTLSLLGLFMIAIQAGQPLVGFASMMAVLATATALSLRTMSRRYAPAAILREQGDAKMADGRYAEAQSFYERALSIVQRELPPNAPEVLLNTYNLAVVSSLLGDHERASSCVSSLLSGLGGRVPSAWAGRMAWLLRRTARHHSSHGRHGAAVAACEQALELVGDAPGADDRTVRSLVDDLGWAHHRAGELRSAETMFRRALAIHEQFREIAIALAKPNADRDGGQRSPYRAPSPVQGSTSGGLDRAVAYSSIGLAWTLLELGDTGEADAYFGRATLLTTGSARTEDGLLRCDALRGRAAVRVQQGAFEEATRAYRRAGEIGLPMGSAQHVALLLGRAALAIECGEDPQADALLVESERRLQGMSGAHGLHARLFRSWAELRRRQCNFKAAHQHAQRAMAIATECLAEHPRRASILTVASRIHTARSEFPAADRCARRAMQILRTRGCDKAHARVAEISVALGELHAARGHWGAAEREFRAALDMREHTVGARHVLLDDALEGLAGVLEATGRGDEALGLRERVTAA